MMPKALSLDRMVMEALLGAPSLTPLEELWKAEEGSGYTRLDTTGPTSGLGLSRV